MAQSDPTIGSRLFGFRGRALRLEWWLTSLGIGVGRIVALIVGMAVTGLRMDEPRAIPLRLAVDLAFLWPSAAIVIRRGHDRNRPAVYSGVVLGAVYAPGMAFGLLIDAGYNNTGVICGLTVVVGWVYMLVDYGLLKGSDGPNRYGPSPKGRGGVGVELAETFD